MSVLLLLGWCLAHHVELVTVAGILVSAYVAADARCGLTPWIKVHLPRLYHFGEFAYAMAPVFSVAARKLVGVLSPSLLAKLEGRA